MLRGHLLLLASLLVCCWAEDSTETHIEKSVHERMADHITDDIHSHKVMVYSKTYCPYSKKLKKILSRYQIADMKVIELDEQDEMIEMQEVLKTMSGRTTVPQLFVNGNFVGGHDETKAIDARGELRPLLEKANALLTNRVPNGENEVIETSSEALQSMAGAAIHGQLIFCSLTYLFRQLLL